MTFTLGCDISRWQDDNSTAQRVDFGKMKARGAEFVFIKASQYNWADEDFIINWANAKQAGLLRGAYHFLTWDDPMVQADFFAGLIKQDTGELPPVCDFEWWKVTPSNALTILKRFCERVKVLTGKTPIIYTAPGFADPLIVDTDTYWQRYDLWIADWGSNDPGRTLVEPRKILPWNTWRFWQFSSKGDGLAFGCESKQVDLDVFNGSKEDLYRYAGLSVPQPPAEPKEEGGDGTASAVLLDIQSKVTDIHARVCANLKA